MTPLKTNRTMLVSAIFRQFGSCYGFFLYKQNKQYMSSSSTFIYKYTYIVIKYKINLHLLQNRLENLFLKFVQTNIIFSENVRILYIYIWMWDWKTAYQFLNLIYNTTSLKIWFFFSNNFLNCIFFYLCNLEVGYQRGRKGYGSH